MDDFKRDLAKSKFDDSLKAIIQVLGKQSGLIAGQISDEERATLLAKQQELTREEDGDVTFDFEFAGNKTETEVEERLALLRTDHIPVRPDGALGTQQEAELWDEPNNIYRTAGNRVYFNRKIFEFMPEDRAGAPIWMGIAQPYIMDITGEVNAVIMLSDDIPDWEASFNTLKKLCKARFYTDKT